MSSPSGDGGDSRAIMERWLQEELDTEEDEGAGAKELSTPKPAEPPSLGARPAHSEEDVLATPAQSNRLRMSSSSRSERLQFSSRAAGEGWVVYLTPKATSFSTPVAGDGSGDTDLCVDAEERENVEGAFTGSRGTAQTAAGGEAPASEAPQTCTKTIFGTPQSAFSSFQDSRHLSLSYSSLQSSPPSCASPRNSTSSEQSHHRASLTLSHTMSRTKLSDPAAVTRTSLSPHSPDLLPDGPAAGLLQSTAAASSTATMPPQQQVHTRMYVCIIHTYIHTCIHTHIDACIHTHTYMYWRAICVCCWVAEVDRCGITHAHTRARAHTHTHTHTHPCTSTYTCTYTFA